MDIFSIIEYNLSFIRINSYVLRNIFQFFTLMLFILVYFFPDIRKFFLAGQDALNA